MVAIQTSLSLKNIFVRLLQIGTKMTTYDSSFSRSQERGRERERWKPQKNCKGHHEVWYRLYLHILFINDETMVSSDSADRTRNKNCHLENISGNENRTGCGVLTR